MEDWENILSEPNQEQSLLRWITGDVDEAFGLRQLLQSGKDFDGNGIGGSRIVDDHGPVFEAVTGVASGVSSIATNLAASSPSGFASINSSNNGNGKFESVGLVSPQSSSSSGWINHETVGLGSKNNSLQNPIFGSPPSSMSLPAAFPHGMVFNHHQIEAPEEKPQILNPRVMTNQQQSHSGRNQNPNFLVPLPFPQQEYNLLQSQPKRPNAGGMDPVPQMIPKLPIFDPGEEILFRQPHQHVGFPQGVQFLHPQLRRKPLMLKKGGGGQLQHQHVFLDQLYKVAELVETGNFSHAHGILARLNQQLSPIGKPLHRAAFYFKEALQLLLLTNSNPVPALQPKSLTPFDVVLKMGAYKVFSEVSPLIQFVNFTCNQALLEAVGDADKIHIIDFDIGFGAQWASFMQELTRNRVAPSLKITAFASPSTHHPVELLLMRKNLTQFANDIGISFELDVVNFDSLDQNYYSLPTYRSSEDEAIGVNFPVWSSSNKPSALPSLLRFVKLLSPKIVVSLDLGCDRIDLTLPQHILHALQSYIHLMESLDAVNIASDAVNKIEKFLLQPRIESTVLGRLREPDKMPNWKTIFASAGFSPVTFSKFTETQAECVIKRTPARGFHVEKRQALLVLCWQRRELISAYAWKC